MNLRDFRKAFTGGAEFRDTSRQTIVGQVNTNYTTYTTSFVNTNKTTVKSTLKNTEEQTVFPTVNLPGYTQFCNAGASTVLELGWWTVDGVNCLSGQIPVNPGTCTLIQQWCVEQTTFRQTVVGQTLKGTLYNTLKSTPYIVGVATQRVTDVYVETVFQTLV